MFNCVKLQNVEYNIELMKQDVAAAIAAEGEYIERVYVKGSSVSLFRDTVGWSSIPLHTVGGVGGNQGNILTDINNKTFKPTLTLRNCPYFQKILQDLNTDIYLVRLMKLSANGYIAPHNDGAQFRDNRRMIRCAIPIVSNDQVIFGIGDKEYNLKVGQLYYTKVDKTHWVRNKSDQDRIHLVIDLKPTLEIMQQIGLTQMSLFKKFYFRDTNCNQPILYQRVTTTRYPQTDLCLVMCQWKRYHTLSRILDSFLKQSVRFDIYLWNNGAAIDNDQTAALMTQLARYADAPFNIYVYHSAHNIKCQGRIITAHILHYLYQHIMFFDDDEIMDNDTVVETFQTEVAQYPNTILSIWALDILSPTHFYQRKRRTNNEIVDYCGGGGVIIPSTLFNYHFLNWLPEKFFNVEDFLCNVYITKYLKGHNRASAAKISFIPNEFNSKDSLSWGNKQCDRTGIEIHDLKNQCLQWAIKNHGYPLRFAANHRRTSTSNKQSTAPQQQNRFDMRNQFSVYKFFQEQSSTLAIVFGHDNTWSSVNCFYDSLPVCKKVFIRDVCNTHYRDGIRNCSTDAPTTVDFLKRKINESMCSKIVVLGTHHAGYAALNYGARLNANQVIVCDPVFPEKYPLEPHHEFSNDNVIILHTRASLAGGAAAPCPEFKAPQEINTLSEYFKDGFSF